jgi:hypothetical protein
VNRLGFLLLASLAVGLLAVTVLVPAYARLAQVRCERQALAACNADMASRVLGNERLIVAAESDPVFITRLAISHGELIPTNERVIASPGRTASPPPDVIAIAPAARPAPPARWLTRAAARLSRPRTRRGMLLLAGGVLLAAGLMFSPASARGGKQG